MEAGDRIQIVDANLARSAAALVDVGDEGVVLVLRLSAFAAVKMNNGDIWTLPNKSFEAFEGEDE